MVKGKRLHQMMCSQSLNYQKLHLQKRLKDSIKYSRSIKFDEVGTLTLEEPLKSF